MSAHKTKHTTIHTVQRGTFNFTLHSNVRFQNYPVTTFFMYILLTHFSIFVRWTITTSNETTTAQTTTQKTMVKWNNSGRHCYKQTCHADIPGLPYGRTKLKSMIASCEELLNASDGKGPQVVLCKRTGVADSVWILRHYHVWTGFGVPSVIHTWSIPVMRTEQVQ